MIQPKVLSLFLFFSVFLFSCSNETFDEIEEVIVEETSSALLDPEANFDFVIGALPDHFRRGRGGNNPPPEGQGNPPGDDQGNNNPPDGQGNNIPPGNGPGNNNPPPGQGNNNGQGNGQGNNNPPGNGPGNNNPQNPPPGQGNNNGQGNGQGNQNNSAEETDNTPADNQVTNEGAALGRVLFYDKNLSQNRTVACASCHTQANGFTDPQTLSDGFAGGKTRRHSMSLTNARFYERGRFFWDERAASLEEQVLMPIQDQVEMGLSLDEMINRVVAENYYPSLFTAAFGDPNVSTERVSAALAQFVRSLVSFESKYDVGRAQVNNRNDNFPNFTASENLGKRLFFGRLNCDRCHGTEAFIAQRGPTNNGLDAVSTTDQGVFETTGNRRDIGRFKVPSLRNVAVGAPFMHDGRFSNLEEVVEHYNSGVQNHQNLDQSLRGQNGEPRRLNLSQIEKNGLVDFLETLTDNNFLTDPKFSDPFR